MPRFKPYDYRQGLMVPLTLEEQLPPGSLEYALHHLIEERIAESWFDDLYAVLARKCIKRNAGSRNRRRYSFTSASSNAKISA